MLNTPVIVDQISMANFEIGGNQAHCPTSDPLSDAENCVVGDILLSCL